MGEEKQGRYQALVVAFLFRLCKAEQVTPPNWYLDRALGDLGRALNFDVREYGLMDEIVSQVLASLGEGANEKVLACLEVHALDNTRRAASVDVDQIWSRMDADEEWFRSLEPDAFAARLTDFLGYHLRVFTRKGGSWSDERFERGIQLSLDSFGITPNPESEAQLVFERLIERANSALVAGDGVGEALAALDAGVEPLRSAIDPNGALSPWIENANCHRLFAQLWADMWQYGEFEADFDALVASAFPHRVALAKAAEAWWRGEFETVIAEATPVLGMKVPADELCTAYLIIARAHAQLGHTEDARAAYKTIVDWSGQDARAVKAVARRELARLAD